MVALEAECNDPYILFRDDLMNANADEKKKPPMFVSYVIIIMLLVSPMYN